MKVELGRVIAVWLAASLAAALSGSCATQQDDPAIFGGGSTPTDGGTDSSAGFGGVGGQSGTGPGGQGGVGPGGAGGVFGQGGVGGTGPGGAGPGGASGTGGDGVGGSGNESGTSGASGTGGTPSTCNPAFCPNTGVGTPCCTDPPNERCGMNTGMGCQRTD